jgi:hypothetical protein
MNKKEATRMPIRYWNGTALSNRLMENEIENRQMAAKNLSQTKFVYYYESLSRIGLKSLEINLLIPTSQIPPARKIIRMRIS